MAQFVLNCIANFQLLLKLASLLLCKKISAPSKLNIALVLLPERLEILPEIKNFLVANHLRVPFRNRWTCPQFRLPHVHPIQVVVPRNPSTSQPSLVAVVG
jgi:hypothetical protein